MSNGAVCRTAPATPGLIMSVGCAWDGGCWVLCVGCEVSGVFGVLGCGILGVWEFWALGCLLDVGSMSEW